MAAPANSFFGAKIDDFLEIDKENVLYYIFKLGTPTKTDTEHLDDFLRNLPVDSSANYARLEKPPLRDLFGFSQRRQMRRDSSCRSFDVFLLCKAIKVACEDVADYKNDAWITSSDLMEYKVTAIMNLAQKATDVEYLRKGAKLRDLLLEALTAAKDKYNVSDDEFSIHCQALVLGMNEVMREILADQINTILRYRFTNTKTFSLMDFLLDNHPFTVENVFTKVQVSHGGWGRRAIVVPYLDILTVAQQPQATTGATRPQLLLVEGPAGSGKTTLVTFLLSEWLKDKPDRQARGLEKYDLLLEATCRERGITSLEGLLWNRLPQAFTKFNKCFWRIIRGFRKLLILDGLDELNRDSQQLLDDLLNKITSLGSITLLVTSRPETTTGFLRSLPQKVRANVVQLSGIQESQRAQFTRTHHKELTKALQSTQSTDEFIERVEPILERELFRMPFNLVILTWVYLHDPEAVSTTITQTQLYYKHCMICTDKVIERTKKQGDIHSTSTGTLEADVQACRQVLNRVMLLALWDSQLTLEDARKTCIEDTCRARRVSPEELLSVFLTLRTTGILEEYWAPHKVLQEFYAALHVVNNLSLTVPEGRVIDLLESTLGPLDRDPSLRSLQNVLRHVVGILHAGQYSVPYHVSEELVDLLHASGIMNKKDFWLDTLEDTRSSPAVLQSVVRYFPADGTPEITSGRAQIYVALMPHLRPCTVTLHFKKEPTGFEDLCKALVHHIVQELVLESHYREPITAVTSDALLLALPSSVSLGSHVNNECRMLSSTVLTTASHSFPEPYTE